MCKQKLLTVALVHLSLLSLAINPERHYPNTPESFQLENYETNFILTPDGHKLISWDFAPKVIAEEKGVIIIACGDSGNMSYSLYYVKQLVNSGYRVITFDYRGFGKSSDFPINKNYLYYNEFSIDLESVLSSSKKKYAREKIGIMAFSMGTIISTLISDRENYDFLIAEDYVFNPKEVARRLKGTTNRNFILPKDSNSYLSLLSTIEFPMLLFSGSKDEITTTADSEAIANMRNNRNLISYNGGHGEGLLSLTKVTYGDIYIKHIIDFLNRFH